MNWNSQKTVVQLAVPAPIYNDNDYMIAWNRPTGSRDYSIVRNSQTKRDVKVGPWPDTQGWSASYTSTSGCCDSHFDKWPEEKQAQALINLAFMIACEGVPIDDILVEFSKIGVWQRMSYPLPGGTVERAFIDGNAVLNPHNP